MALSRRVKSVLQATLFIASISVLLTTLKQYRANSASPYLQFRPFGLRESSTDQSDTKHDGISSPTPTKIVESENTMVQTTVSLVFGSTQSAPTLVNQPQRMGDATLLAQAATYVRAILNSSDTTFDRLECPNSDLSRYENLRNDVGRSGNDRSPRYYFALDLHQCIYILPRLIGSILQAIRYLGPENCVLSIVEGRSEDGTYETLSELRADLHRLGVRYNLQTSGMDPKSEGADRVAVLAQLRQLAVQDLAENPSSYADDTTVVFLNDVALCREDILELIHQKKFQEAHITCAMDWTYLGEHPSFYDVWIARGMTGDTFFPIPPDGSYDQHWNLFWNDEKAHARWSSNMPFQVFSCWNGITAFTAKPIMEGKVGFRKKNEEECYQGEPSLFSKDMWWAGYGRVAVVPSINLEYSDSAAKKIKALKGYVQDNVKGQDGREGIKIEWEKEPPKEVKCMPTHDRQSFVPWNEGLPQVAS
ncbi:cryptococcal mannosyltransferase 1-domain-containing protein [Clohesyomyces aquaticus]|uniref:Cryptococcal mannosyltransferase 1-domain-containing protein n=1 Tax=Clohesyomyces aquaticus TaxID=1231657 RepID=A0A1Y1XZE4_9PLEO|nr:cryptococcal mannosyltransferase 1-domain-containing protein [Clohesyomyces aquaticus]